MTYDRFEHLPVWQAAIELGERVYAATEKPAFRRRFSLRDQIERATVSISNNIAEGFERGTTQELLTFLYIARGSAGEFRSMLCLIERFPAFADLKSEISHLKFKAESHFAAAPRLGRVPAELQDHRTPLPEQRGQKVCAGST